MKTSAASEMTADVAPEKHHVSSHGLPVPRGFQRPKPGDLFVCAGNVIRVITLESTELASVINVATGVTTFEPLVRLRPLADVVHEMTESSDSDAEKVIANDRVDPTGERHARVSRWVRRLTRANRPIRNATIKKVATHLGMGQTAFRIVVARFRRTGQVILEYKRGRKAGKKYLDPLMNGFIQTAIEEVAKRDPDCSPANVLKALDVPCSENGLKPPSIQVIKSRILVRPPSELARASGHDDRKKAVRLIRGHSHGGRALEVVQIDFTIADLIIVDDIYRRPIGRPLMGLAIDVATRCVLAAWLFLEAPNHFTSGWMIAHAILPKTEILQWLGIGQFPDPCFGRMEKIFVDNGFRIKALVDACRRANVDVAFRHPGECQQGGIIERLVGTFVNELHMLHGTTYANPLTRRRAKIDPEKTACYTWTEAMQYLYSQVHIYHHSRHGGIKKEYPIDRWHATFGEGGQVVPPALPLDPTTFFIPFLWNKTPVIHRGGIYLEQHWYRSPDLEDCVGMRLRTYYNKSDPIVCYPEVRPGSFLRIPREPDDGDCASTMWCEKFLRKFPLVEADHVKHLAARASARSYQARLDDNAQEATRRAKLLPAPPAQSEIVHRVLNRIVPHIANPTTERFEE